MPENESNPFKKLAEVFKRKKPPTEIKPAQKQTKPKEAAEVDEDPGYITIIQPGTGFPLRIPRGR